MAGAAVSVDYPRRLARELRMLKKRAGQNGKPSSRREQPNPKFFRVIRCRAQSSNRSWASAYALISSEICLPLRERRTSGKGITSPLPNPTAVRIVISASRLFATAARAHFVRLGFCVPGRRWHFCSLSSAAIAVSRARFFCLSSIRIVSSFKRSLPGSAQHS